jgi:hypothetical protein
MPSERIAYHEAGHAVFAYHHNITIHEVSIIPRPWRDDGHVDTEPYGNHCGPVELGCLMAGPAAQRRFVGHSGGGSDDYIRAVGLCQFLTGEKDNRLFLRDMERQTAEFVDYYWGDIVTVARALIERSELDGWEVRDLLTRDPAADLDMLACEVIADQAMAADQALRATRRPRRRA